MNRSEHMEWCKKRALEYCDTGDIQNAFRSMASDLRKHDETRGHTGMLFGASMLLNGMLETEPEMRKFINGFN